jgi:hypothetical protein
VGATGAAGTTGAGLIQATTAVKLALGTKGTLTTTTPASSAVQASGGGVVVRADAGSDVATVLNALAGDPTASGDFFARLDFGAGIVAADVQTLSGSGMDALAMLNTPDMLLPFDTSQPAFLFG